MPKGPFEIASPEHALSRDLIAYNTGNLIFLEAAYKLLDTRDAVITPDRLEAPTIDPGSINERFDVYVVTLANAFRPSFEKYLQRLTSVIEKLTIPVTVLGVGLQAPLPYESGASRAWDDSVKEFVRRRAGPLPLDRRPRRVHPGLPQPARFPRRRGHRLPVDVHARRPDDHHEAHADPRARRPDRHEHHHPGQPRRSARDIASRALPQPRVHRPGPDRAEPDAVGRGRRGGEAHQRHADPSLASAVPGRQGPVLRRSVAVDRSHADGGLHVRDPHPRQYRGAPGRTTELRPGARLADARAGPLLRDPASGRGGPAAGHGRGPAVRGGGLRSAPGRSRPSASGRSSTTWSARVSATSSSRARIRPRSTGRSRASTSRRPPAPAPTSRCRGPSAASAARSGS